MKCCILSVFTVLFAPSLQAADVFIHMRVTNAERNHEYAVEAWEARTSDCVDDPYRIGTVVTDMSGDCEFNLAILDGALPDGRIIGDGIGSDQLVLVLDRSIPGCFCGDQFTMPGTLPTPCGAVSSVLTVPPSGGVACDGHPGGGAVNMSGFAVVGYSMTLIGIFQSPHSTYICGTTAPFFVDVAGVAPFTYQWQLEVSPGNWLTLTRDPAPLPCGGNASHAYAQPPDEATTNVTVFGCTGDFGVRCIVTNACGSVTSDEATLHIQLGPRGDLNCDGAINNFDIDPFVLALTNPSGYAAAYPACDLYNADINCDGAVNNFDIDPFVQCLTGGCP
jgi:hypothetical protein